jgi:uncharacterized membrane protein YecN with MAPEG domain
MTADRSSIAAKTDLLVAAVPAHFALDVFYPGSPAIVPVFGAFFCAGRVLFWIGYRSGPVARAFGFAMTFYPSVAALIVSGGLLISR